MFKTSSLKSLILREIFIKINVPTRESTKVPILHDVSFLNDLASKTRFEGEDSKMNETLIRLFH